MSNPLSRVLFALLIAFIAFGAAQSALAQNAPVPNVIGKKSEAAAAELQAAGFRVGNSGQFGPALPAGDKRAGTVNKTEPPAGTLRSKGSTVVIWVFGESKPPPAATAPVPNVMGKKPEVAAAELQAAGFRVGRSGQFGPALPAGDKRAGTVNKMEPAAGVAAPKGSTVVIWVFGESQPPPTAGVPVPNVMGRKLAAAFAELQAAGFQVGQRGSNGAVPAGDPRGGTVNRMEPPAGKPAPKGSKVDVWVFAESGPPPTANVPVPNVMGKKLAAAFAELQAAGFQVGQRGSNGAVPAGDPRGGTVNKMEPAAGASAPKGSAVNVWVFAESGPPPAANVPVPNVMGKKLAAAFAELQAAGFQVGQRGSNGSVPTGDPRGGTVNKMEPAAGASAPKGAVVNVWVFAESGPPPAAGPATVTVPNVIGKSYYQALRELQAAGLNAQINETPVPHDDPRAGKVYATQPAAGTPISKLTIVQVMAGVASGPAAAANIAVPNVTGKKQAAAVAELRAAGFGVVAIMRDANVAVPATDPRNGTVYKSDPLPGTFRPKGSEVKLWVWAERGRPAGSQ
jgi:beta-lactam-binding protein with PASTA domain